jgi:branched-chain amino acid transport system ATP-binding protein
MSAAQPSNAIEPILEVNNIEVVYNKAIQALRGLSLAVPKGKIVALLGSNGAGKSTVLKAVSALLPMENGLVTEGRITFDGEAVEQSAPHRLVRRGLFHVMEGRRIFGDLTVEENLTAATYALTGRPDITPDFDIVYRYFPRLAERRKSIAGYLSGGEQQMLAIGRALSPSPRHPAGRALARPRAAAGRGNLRHHRPHQCRGGRLHAARRAERLGGAVHRPLRLHHGDRPHRHRRPTEKLTADRDVQEFYLGLAHKSYRDIKHYKRRKRWLS